MSNGNIVTRLKQSLSAGNSQEKDKITEAGRARPEVGPRVKHGLVNIHTSISIHLRRDQIKALVITTTAETSESRRQSGAIPPILMPSGTIAIPFDIIFLHHLY